MLSINVIHEHAQLADCVVVDTDEDSTIVDEEFTEELETWQHHAEPVLVAGVVGRVDVDALDLSGVHGQQGLEGLEVVAVDDEIVVQADLVRQGLLRTRDQLVVLDQQVMVLDKGLAFEIQHGHDRRTPFDCLPSPDYRERGGRVNVRTTLCVEQNCTKTRRGGFSMGLGRRDRCGITG
jgi:hypothetical protein